MNLSSLTPWIPRLKTSIVITNTNHNRHFSNKHFCLFLLLFKIIIIYAILKWFLIWIRFCGYLLAKEGCKTNGPTNHLIDSLRRFLRDCLRGNSPVGPHMCDGEAHFLPFSFITVILIVFLAHFCPLKVF